MSLTRTMILDAAIAIAFTVALIIEQVVVTTDSTTLPISIALSIVIGASLAVRRRWPLIGYAVGSAALILVTLWNGPTSLAPFANLIGLFSLAAYGTRRRALAGLLVMLPGVLIYFASTTESYLVVTGGVLGVWTATWAVGYQLARTREQGEAARAALRREAMADERVRIARELHDVVGHTVNLMLVQSGATRMIMESDPERAREMLLGVETSARQALSELDQLLGLLSEDSEPSTQPGLKELPALAERMAEAGLLVSLDIAASDLPPQIDVVAYRIVQEALTNSLRHGAATAATVSVRGTAELQIEVDDNGKGPTEYEPGRGLRGMAERAALFSGSVGHHRDAQGFHLSATLVVP